MQPVVQPVVQPTDLTTSCIVYTNIQPVVKPIEQPVWQPVECLFTRRSRMFNRLYRVNGVLQLFTASAECRTRVISMRW